MWEEGEQQTESRGTFSTRLDEALLVRRQLQRRFSFQFSIEAGQLGAPSHQEQLPSLPQLGIQLLSFAIAGALDGLNHPRAPL